MGELVRIPLYSRRKKLLGYWAMREVGKGGYRVSYRYPGQKHKRYETDDPEHAVSIFYNTYVGFLGRKLSEIDNQLAELPTQEYRKRGFRKGWLNRVRSALRRDRRSIIRETRKVLAEKLSKLGQAGWPQPPLPKMPWDDLDGEKTAGAVYAARLGEGSGDQPVPSTGPADQPGQSANWAQLPASAVHARPGRGGDSGPWDLHAPGGGSPGVEADGIGAGEPGDRAHGRPFTWSIGQGLQHFPRTGQADSGDARGPDRS